jgi:hypothetical protein
MNKVKGEVKLPLCLTKHHPMKTYWGSEGIAPRILNLGLFTPAVKSLRYPLGKRLGEPQSRSGRGGEEKNPIIVPSEN